jgi:hypothetical protein
MQNDCVNTLLEMPLHALGIHADVEAQTTCLVQLRLEKKIAAEERKTTVSITVDSTETTKPVNEREGLDLSVVLVRRAHRDHREGVVLVAGDASGGPVALHAVRQLRLHGVALATPTEVNKSSHRKISLIKSLIYLPLSCTR